MKQKGWVLGLATIFIIVITIYLKSERHVNSGEGGGNVVKQLEVQNVDDGKGTRTVTIGNKVTVHYTAWRWDGRMFDSSYDHQKPLVFRVGEGTVFRGIEQGVIGMKVGGKRKLTIPPDMAAGVNGTGGAIPQNAALVYEVELIKID